MNFLAHLYLSPPDEELFVGNYLGDFVKGTPESLLEKFPLQVVTGIRMHRSVDVLTDSHAAFAEARELLAPERRRFAGIIVDVIYDYFLSRDWAEYSQTPLDEFIVESYAKLGRQSQWMSESTQRSFEAMRRDDWLTRYGSEEGLALTLKNMSLRFPKLAGLAGGIEDFQNEGDQFEQSFKTLFPDLRKKVAAFQ